MCTHIWPQSHSHTHVTCLQGGTQEHSTHMLVHTCNQVHAVATHALRFHGHGHGHGIFDSRPSKLTLLAPDSESDSDPVYYSHLQVSDSESDKHLTAFACSKRPLWNTQSRSWHFYACKVAQQFVFSHDANGAWPFHTKQMAARHVHL